VIRDLLAWHCEILDSDSAQVARDKLALAFGTPFGARAEEQAALVGQLIGLDFSASPHIAGILKDGRQIRTRAFHAIAQYLRLLCSRDAGSVVVLLDDLHWADDASLDFIDYLAAACRDLPLLLACFTRPALFERRPQWGQGVADSLRIDLEPLAADGTRNWWTRCWRASRSRRRSCGN
jgi:predicted ATPase